MDFGICVYVTSSNSQFPEVPTQGGKLKSMQGVQSFPQRPPNLSSCPPVACLGLSESIPHNPEHQTLASSGSTCTEGAGIQTLLASAVMLQE